MEPVKLYERKRSMKDALKSLDRLVGIDQQKQDLLLNLELILQPDSLKKWERKHHRTGLPFLEHHFNVSPLVLLSGDVGCGKTELANAIGASLMEKSGKTVRTFETPSDIRGDSGVGGIPARITAAFKEATRLLKSGEKGVLIIDEADDLATEREQEQAHHEDRTGVNALIKELDRLEKDKAELAVIFITNRSNVMDPAILRRAAVEIKFERPGPEQVKKILEHILQGLPTTPAQITQLAHICKPKPFTYSDLFRRVAYQTLIAAWQRDQPFSVTLLQETIERTVPTPQFKKS